MTTQNLHRDAGTEPEDEPVVNDTPPASRDLNAVMAALNPVLERFDAKIHQWLPCLGTLQGGAMEDMLLEVTGIKVPDEGMGTEKVQKVIAALQAGDPHQVAQAMGIPKDIQLSAEKRAIFDQFAALAGDRLAGILATEAPSPLPEPPSEAEWAEVKQALLDAGLMTIEIPPGISMPYLRFVDLAPALRVQLDAEQDKELQNTHRMAYFRLSRYLQMGNSEYPEQMRTIAGWEMPNLLHAVYAALDAGNVYAEDFVDNVAFFLNIFGWDRIHKDLLERRNREAEKADLFEHYFITSNRGERLFRSGRYEEAQEVFAQLLKKLGDTPSYEHCVTLNRLGRCFEHQGLLGEAEIRYRDALELIAQLEQTRDVQRQTGVLHGELGGVLMEWKDYAAARAEYEKALAVMQTIGDRQSIGVTVGQLGNVALEQENFAEAEQRFRAALEIFQELGDSAAEGGVQYQRGRAFQEQGEWQAARQAYRAAARLDEARGHLLGATHAWNQLALVAVSADEPDEAIIWYRKAFKGFRQVRNTPWEDQVFISLFEVYRKNFPERLDEIQSLAEASLAAKRALRTGQAAIGKTYRRLADIVEQQGDEAQAAKYRRMIRALETADEP